ncbi:V-set and transmembrane domain-containing protein 4 [Collichthys lucidus]|uniref:V-set and transmembrane domain-containing protein 4 n=1 Tax=Collichthys lucidus TaxID=240159 RepID=A0A4U5TWA4_COLLU|nr:V-set and transmembrane domain-containing protein 4 [Collichthys lucidus]
MYFSIVVLVLTKALVTEVCHALNVTVTPGPVIMVTEKDNLTLSCLVSQRKRSGSVLILRWFFSPLVAPTLTPPPTSPSPSPPALESSQFLIVKMGIKKMKLYGNYTRRFPQPKFRLYEETEGEVYRLWILSVTGMDQGFYTCRVQEIRKHRSTWRASSNGTSTTQLTDVYLCAVLICSLGLLSIFLFTLVLTFQHFYRRHRLKVPVAVKRPQKPRRLKTHLKSSATSRVSQEDSLTYAELELVRPRPEPPSSPEPTPSSPDTVYAQILFQEKQL